MPEYPQKPKDAGASTGNQRPRTKSRHCTLKPSLSTKSDAVCEIYDPYIGLGYADGFRYVPLSCIHRRSLHVSPAGGASSNRSPRLLISRIIEEVSAAVCSAMGVKPTVVLRAAAAAGVAAAAQMATLFKAAGGVKMGAVGAAMAAATAAAAASPKKKIDQQ